MPVQKNIFIFYDLKVGFLVIFAIEMLNYYMILGGMGHFKIFPYIKYVNYCYKVVYDQNIIFFLSTVLPCKVRHDLGISA